jgi:hypothetical protein
MLAGYSPFVGKDSIETYSNIMRGDVRLPRDFDKDARALLRHLLVADVTRRYGCLRGGAADVLQHAVSGVRDTRFNGRCSGGGGILLTFLSSFATFQFFATVDLAALLRCELPPPRAPGRGESCLWTGGGFNLSTFDLVQASNKSKCATTTMCDAPSVTGAGPGLKSAPEVPMTGSDSELFADW